MVGTRRWLLIFLVSTLALVADKPADFYLEYTDTVQTGVTSPGKVLWLPATTLKKEDGAAVALDYHPDGKSIYVADRLGRLTKYDLTTGRQVYEVRPWGAIEGYALQLSVSPDGKYIAINHALTNKIKQEELLILNASDGSLFRKFRIRSFLPQCYERTWLQPHMFKFSKTSREIYIYYRSRKTNYYGCSVAEDEWLVKADIKSKKFNWIYQIPLPRLRDSNISCNYPPVRFDVDKKEQNLVYGDCMGFLSLLDARTGKRKKLSTPFFKIRDQKGWPGADSTLDVKFGPRGRKLYVIQADYSSHAYLYEADLKSLVLKKRLARIASQKPSLEISPNGQYLAAGLWIWNLKTRKIVSAAANSYGSKFNPRYRQYANTLVGLLREVKARKVRVSGSGSSGCQVGDGIGVYVYGNVKFRATYGSHAKDVHSSLPYLYDGGSGAPVKQAAELILRPDSRATYSVYCGRPANWSKPTMLDDLKRW